MSHATLASIEYPAHFELRRASRNRGIRWHAHWANVSHILADQHIGFEEIDKGRMDRLLWLSRYRAPLMWVDDPPHKRSASRP